MALTQEQYCDLSFSRKIGNILKNPVLFFSVFLSPLRLFFCKRKDERRKVENGGILYHELHFILIPNEELVKLGLFVSCQFMVFFATSYLDNTINLLQVISLSHYMHKMILSRGGENLLLFDGRYSETVTCARSHGQ